MSINLDIYNQKAEKIGDLKVSSEIFDLKVNLNLLHQAVVTQMANERQVLAHTKGRSEVRGGGKKPWKQKGTGRARAGSNRSPIWIGGGVTFGPTNNRNFKKKINKKMKQKALLMVVSDKIKNNKIVVLDKIEITEFKTKIFNSILNTIEKKILIKTKTTNKDVSKDKKEEKNKPDIKKTKRSILIINNKKDEKTKYSARNLVGVKFLNLNNINLIDILKYQNLIISKEAVVELEKKYKK